MALASITFGEGLDLVLLHGWRAHKGLWDDWARHYFVGYRVTLVDLPGHGDSSPIRVSDDQILDAWQDAILQVLPAKSIVIGWSLGGLLAQHIALHHPDRISALILLASSPCFVQREDWQPALERPMIAQYLIEVVNNASALFKSFFMLQSLGSPQPKSVYKKMVSMLSVMSTDIPSMRQGLLLLESVDLRQSLAMLTQPTLWVLPEEDAIVPITLADALKTLQPKAHIATIPNCGHLPFLICPEPTAACITSFFGSCND